MNARANLVRQSDITRERILDAAFAEIHRYGFQAASIASILAKTDLTKGALYHHFPAKQDLGLAVIDEVVRGRLTEIIFDPLRRAADPIQALLDIVRYKRDHPEFVELGCPLNNLMQEMSPVDETFRRHLNAVMEEWQTAVAEALTRGQQQGQVRADIDAQATALFVVSAFEGCIGVAKSLQSIPVYQACLQQLYDYVSRLRV